MLRVVPAKIGIVLLETLIIGLALLNAKSPEALVYASRLGAIATAAELPRVLLDTRLQTSSGSVIRVADGGDLQQAINSAQPGDVIALSPRATFVGNFRLPAKVGDSWVIIRPDIPDSLLPHEGERISAAYFSAIPKILSMNADAAIETVPGAHHYRLVGLEIGVTNSVQVNYGVVRLGDGSKSQNTVALIPHDLIIDRCYIHGNSTGAISRGIALNSARTSVIDSVITECHEVATDTQAIGGWNGPGPFKIVNNYLEGAGENFMLGGADAAITDLVSEDIEFRRNYCFKPLRWKLDDPGYAGIHWGVKNLFELKNARRVLIDGNVFEQNWVDGQNGFAVLFTPRNEEGASPWSVVEDVTFTNNIVRHTTGAINILGRDDIHVSAQTRRIRIANNLFYDIGGLQWGNNGTFLQLTDTPDVIIDHNTVVQTGNMVSAYGAPNNRFDFQNNILPHNQYGLVGDGTPSGNASLNQYFTDPVFVRNVLIGAPEGNYPTNNFFPSLLEDVGFTDVSAGNFRLKLSSQFKGLALNGNDPGCDFDSLSAATADVAVSPFKRRFPELRPEIRRQWPLLQLGQLQ